MADLTAETVTDEEIRELRDSEPVTGAFMGTYNNCVIALGTDPLFGIPASQIEISMAKGRCAEAINARRKPAP